MEALEAGNSIPHSIPHMDKVYRSKQRLSRVNNKGLNRVFYEDVR
jgi:hypothetical protein